MKKLFVLVLLLSMVLLFSGVVSADEHHDPWKVGEGMFTDWIASRLEPYADKKQDSSTKTEEYIVVEGMGVTRGGVDQYPGDQTGTITIPAEAYIPCYIEMQIRGNYGYTKVKSLGDGAHVDAGFGVNNFLLFMPHLTGLMDSEWMHLPFMDGDNYNWDFSTLPADAYIGACDMLELRTLGNTPYKVTIAADGFKLSPDGTENAFYMEARYTDEFESSNFTPLGELTSNPKDIITSPQIGVAEYRWLQFRIPMDMGVAGKYETDVIFHITTSNL